MNRQGVNPVCCCSRLAASARLAYLFQFLPTMESAYWSISEQLLRTGTLTIDGVAVTDYEPLYLMCLAAARTLVGDRMILVQILQIAVVSLGAVFLYQLSLALTGSTRAATIGGVLFAVHPLLIRQAVCRERSLAGDDAAGGVCLGVRVDAWCRRSGDGRRLRLAWPC